MSERSVKTRWLAGFFLVGAAGVLYILPSLALQLIFGFLALLVLVWVWRRSAFLDINTLALLIGFVLSVAQFGLHFYFSLSGWLVLLISFIWVSLVFYLGFRIITGRQSGSLNVMSLATGLIGAEIALALIFWPIHFLVASTVFFLLFYLAWMVTYFYLNGLLNMHRLMIHTAFVVVVLTVVLLTAKWSL